MMKKGSISLAFLLILTTLVTSYAEDSIAPLNQAPESSPQQPFPVDPQAAGPDTANYTEEVIGSYGNWIKKSDWWQQLKEVIIKIGTITKEIADARQQFRQKYIAIGNQHTEFFKKFGFDEGKLDGLFESIDKYLEKQRARKVAEFSEKSKSGEIKAREIQTRIDLVDEKIKSYKVRLEQLKLDLQSIEELDKSLLDRLTKVDEHITQINQDNAKVREIQKTMLYVVDHNKARDLYYKLKDETLAKLESIKIYLTQTLMQDFETVSSVITTQIQKSTEAIKELEEKGLIVKDRAQEIAKIRQRNEQKEGGVKKQTNELAAQKQKIKKEPELSFFSRIYDNIIDMIASFITSIQELIYGKPKQRKKAIITPASVTPATPPAATSTVPAEQKKDVLKT